MQSICNDSVVSFAYVTSIHPSATWHAGKWQYVFIESICNDMQARALALPDDDGCLLAVMDGCSRGERRWPGSGPGVQWRV